MSSSVTTAEGVVTLDQRRQRGLWGDAWRRLLRSSSGRIGLGITIFLVLIAIFIPLLMPYNPATDRNFPRRLLKPSWLLSEDVREQKNIDLLEHPFGTDDLGRDIFRRVLHGTPISLTAGLFTVSMAVVFGSLLGLIAGYLGGWFDTVASWVMDILLAFPSILLAIAIVSASNSPTAFTSRLGNAVSSLPVLRTIFDPQLFNAMLAVAIVEIPIFGRIARSTVIAVRHQEYVTAATALGVSGPRTLFRHILPNSLAPMLVQATLSIATAIISVAALSFLGLGAQRPRPEWGRMLADARQYLLQGSWWYITFPGLAIMLTVLGINLLGDGLRDALDPRLKSKD
ncbi:MAG: peptide ABC transporter permease [Herpetosiphonaceae bacterium]|nr:MAG: peptide ABC transporter permease [Herpetosiphonaceae bacterium]